VELGFPPDNLKNHMLMERIFSVLPLGVLVWEVHDVNDPYALQLVFANNEANKVVSGNLHALIGLTVEEAFPGFVDTGFPAAYLEAFASNQERQLGEVTYGSEHVKRATYAVKVSPFSELDCVAVFFENITEEKKAENKFKENEKKYRKLIEVMRAGVWVLDKNACTTYVNPRMASMLGYSISEIIGQPVVGFLTKDGQKALHAGLERRRRGVSESYFLEFFSKANQIVHTSADAVPITDEQGEYMGAMACIADVTKQHAAEKKLREGEKKYRELVELVQEGIWAIDAEANTTFVNPLMAAMLEYTVDEMQGKHLFDFMDEEGVNIAQRKLKRREEGVKENHPFELLTKSGRRIYTKMETVPINNDEGSYVGALACVSDITEKRESERRLQEQQAELTHVSRLSVLGEMATSLAHELNQPLTSIAGYTQGCIERVRHNRLPSSELLEVLSQVAAQTDRAAAVMKRVRDFVKKAPPKRELIDINQLIHESLVFFSLYLERYQVRVNYKLAELLPEVFIDRVEIQQVILNLMSNAVDSLIEAGREEKQIIVSTCQEADLVMLTVRDFGKGMSEAAFSKVFKPFYTTKEKGTGMGLSICHSIVEAHGGRMLIDRKLDQGVSVSIVLPIIQGE
jgi:PAS domain S-box-containing protein